MGHLEVTDHCGNRATVQILQCLLSVLRFQDVISRCLERRAIEGARNGNVVYDKNGLCHGGLAFFKNMCTRHDILGGGNFQTEQVPNGAHHAIIGVGWRGEAGTRLQLGMRVFHGE